MMKLAVKFQDQTTIKDKYTGAKTPVYRLERLAGLALLSASNSLPENPILEVQPKKVGEYLYVNTVINPPAQVVNNYWIIVDADDDIVVGVIDLVEKAEAIPVYLWQKGAWHSFPHVAWEESGEHEEFKTAFTEIAAGNGESRTYSVPRREKVLVTGFTPIQPERAKQWGLPEYNNNGEQIKHHASGAIILQRWEGKGIIIEKTIREGAEITSAWYWISGNTWDYRDQIKAIEPSRDILAWGQNYKAWVYKHPTLPKAFFDLIGYNPNQPTEKRQAGEVTAEQVQKVLQMLLREPFEPMTFPYPDRDPWTYPEVIDRPISEVVVHAIREVSGARSNVVIYTANGDDPARISPLKVADVDYFATLAAWAAMEADTHPSSDIFQETIMQPEAAAASEAADTSLTPEELAVKVEAWAESFTPDRQYGDHKAAPVIEVPSPEKDDAHSLMPEWLWKQARTAYRTQEGKGRDAIVWAKFFWPGYDWDCFVVDYDARHGDAFCFVILNGDYQMAEYGYQNIAYLESQVVRGMRVERNLYWKPVTLQEALNEWWQQRGYGSTWGEHDPKSHSQLETEIKNSIYALWCASTEDYVVRCDFPGVQECAYVETLYEANGMLYVKFWTLDNWGNKNRSDQMQFDQFAALSAKILQKSQGAFPAPTISLMEKETLNQLAKLWGSETPQDIPLTTPSPRMPDAISDFIERDTPVIADAFTLPPMQQSGPMEVADTELEDLFHF